MLQNEVLKFNQDESIKFLEVARKHGFKPLENEGGSILVKYKFKAILPVQNDNSKTECIEIWFANGKWVAANTYHQDSTYCKEPYRVMNHRFYLELKKAFEKESLSVAITLERQRKLKAKALAGFLEKMS